MTQTRAIQALRQLLITHWYPDCYCIRLRLYGKAIQFEVHKVCRGLLQECGLRSPGSFPGPARISRHQIQRGRSRDGGCAGHAADSVSRSVALAAANPPGSVPKPPHPRGAGVTSARKSVIGWGGEERGRGGRGFPQIQLRREEKGGRKRKMHDGKNRCKATFLHPALWLKPWPVFTPLGILP